MRWTECVVNLWGIALGHVAEGSDIHEVATSFCTQLEEHHEALLLEQLISDGEVQWDT